MNNCSLAQIKKSKKEDKDVNEWNVKLQVNDISKNLKLDTVVAFLGRQLSQKLLNAKVTKSKTASIRYLSGTKKIAFIGHWFKLLAR